MNVRWLALTLLISTYSFAGINEVTSCLKVRLGKLTNRRSIVAAVVAPYQTETLLFGEGKIDQIFEIGSITKTYTGTLMAHAVLEGRIKGNDPIPDTFQQFEAKITYEQLATHTAGYTNSIKSYYDYQDPTDPYAGLTKILFKELYPKVTLVSKPGEKFLYSNTGVGILGMSLEEIYGETYEKLVQTKILDVLDMKDTYFEVPLVIKHRFPQGIVNNQKWPYWNLYKTALSSAGSLRSTVADMTKYVRANIVFNESELSKALELSHKPIFQLDKRWLGMNWFTNPKWDLVWHSGSTIAFNSYLLVDKREKLGIIAMTDTAIYKPVEGGKEEYDNSMEDAVESCLLD